MSSIPLQVSSMAARSMPRGCRPDNDQILGCVRCEGSTLANRNSTPAVLQGTEAQLDAER